MSLDLDRRQRAMLQEMGVHVWLPQTEEVAPVALARPAPEPVRAPVSVPVPQASAPIRQSGELPVASAVEKPTAVAIENIAAHALFIRATGQKDIKKEAQMAPPMPVDGLAIADWSTLADAVAHCQSCLLCTGRKAPVLAGARPDVPRRADWLVVGEPPDETEERAGTPFAEQVGELLDNMLKAVGVGRHSGASAESAAYVTNVVKCRPALARNPSAQELAVCEHFLQREVALVQPKVILAMGRFAAQTLLHGSLPEGSKLPFGKLRGQIYRYQGIPVIVTYHPTYLLRTQHDKARAWADLCLAMEVVRGAS